MYIYDRWGNLVFQTSDPDEGWDGNFSSGKAAPADVYVVKILAKSAYREDKEYDFTKTVTLVR